MSQYSLGLTSDILRQSQESTMNTELCREIDIESILMQGMLK